MGAQALTYGGVGSIEQLGVPITKERVARLGLAWLGGAPAASSHSYQR